MEQFFLESLEYVKNEIVRNRYSKLLHKCVHCAMNFCELMSRGHTKKIEIASTESTARSFNLGYYLFNISSTDSKS